MVRGIQLGLGLRLAQPALWDSVPSESAAGCGPAGAAFVLTLFLLGSRRYLPATLVILGLFLSGGRVPERWARVRRGSGRSAA